MFPASLSHLHRFGTHDTPSLDIYSKFDSKGDDDDTDKVYLVQNINV